MLLCSYDKRSRICLDVARMGKKGLVLTLAGIFWSSPAGKGLKSFVANQEKVSKRGRMEKQKSLLERVQQALLFNFYYP